MKTLSDIAHKFNNAREKNPSQWIAACPCCGKDQHLYISLGDKGNNVVMYCQACGSTGEKVCQALGYAAKDILYLDEPTRQVKGTTVARPVKEGHGAIIDQRSHVYKRNGETVGIKCIKKHEDGHKDVYWKRADGQNRQPDDCPLYNEDSISSSTSVWVVEGEKDVDTMIQLGYPNTVSFPNGASKEGSKWDDRLTNLFAEKQIYVITDNDASGQEHGKWLSEKTKSFAAAVRIISAKDIYPRVPDKGDISDIVQEIGSEQAKKLLEDAVRKNRESNLAKLGIYKASDLATMNLQPPPFIVRELLPVGLTVFAAPPKTGKSFACMDLCAAVATGGNYWGRHTNKGAVLYCDLESAQWRVKDRYQKMGIPLPEDLHIVHRVPPIDEGLYTVLYEWLESVNNPRLIVIDTLGNIKSRHGSRKDAYTQDTQTLHPLQQFAIKNKIAVLVVTHLRKNGSTDPDEELDPYERITGSNGQLGAADTAWMILGKRKENAKKPTEFGFRAGGRDFPDISLQILWNPDTLRWQLLGDTAELREERRVKAFINSPVVQTIIHYVESSATKEWKVTASEMLRMVYQYTKKTDVNAASEKSLGKYVAAIEEMLLTDCNILHEKMVRYNAKAGGKIHTFRKISDQETGTQEII